MLRLLENSPDAEELRVERVKPQRFAEASGSDDAFYAKFNDTLTRARASR
jgi:uncharacterized oxidoreductase